ncbi:MAG: PAS domain S-box protein [Anaerolineae bacterium]|nr:PAS domain S-box protein [Anaerolineae bacterium]
MNESNAFNRTVLELLTDAIISTDLSFNIRSWNKSAEEIYGWPAAEVVGQPLPRVVSTSYPDNTPEEVFAQLLQQGQWQGEVVHKRKDGAAINIQASMSILKDNDGHPTGAVSVNRDITEHKRMEAALRKSKELFAKAFHGSPLPMMLARRTDGAFIEVNESFLRLYEYNREEVIGRTSLDLNLIDPEIRTENARLYRRQGTSRNNEIQVRTKSGRPLTVLVSVESTELAGEACVITTVLDITERREAEQALQESQRLLREAQEYGRIGSWELDLVQNEFHLSDIFIEFHGMSQNTYIPDKMYRYLYPEDEAQVAQAFDNAMAGQEYDVVHRIYREDTGAIRWVHARGLLIRDEMGNPLRIVGSSQDVTEQKQAEETLKRYNERLTVLHEIDQGIVAARSAKDIMQPALQGIRRLIPCTRVGIALIETVSAEVVIFALNGDTDSLLETGQRMPLVHNQLIEQLAAGQAVVIPDLSLHQHSASPETVKQLVKEGLRSSLTIPLIMQEQLIGVFFLVDATPHYFTAEHQEIAGEVASQLVIAIQQHRLQEQIRRHAQELEQRVAERTAELEEQYRRQAALEERQRLARELHDAVSQSLFSARVIAESLPRLWERNPELVRSSLTDLHRLTRGALAEMRTLLLELRPAALEEVSLGELLQQLTEGIAGRSQVEVTLTVEGQDAVPTEVKIALFRMAQEALNNTIKHARAKQISVKMVSRPDEIRLHISDNGRGFNPADRPSGHLGLQIMAERAEAIGARLQISSRINAGTVVNIVWPNTLPEEKL